MVESSSRLKDRNVGLLDRNCGLSQLYETLRGRVMELSMAKPAT